MTSQRKVYTICVCIRIERHSKSNRSDQHKFQMCSEIIAISVNVDIFPLLLNFSTMKHKVQGRNLILRVGSYYISCSTGIQYFYTMYFMSWEVWYLAQKENDPNFYITTTSLVNATTLTWHVQGKKTSNYIAPKKLLKRLTLEASWRISWSILTLPTNPWETNHRGKAPYHNTFASCKYQNQHSVFLSPSLFGH